MFVVSDNARENIGKVLQSQHAAGKSLVLYLQGAG